MITFFESIGAMISSVINFVVSFFESLISFMAYMVSATIYLHEVILFLPPVLKIAAAAVIGIAIFHFITLSA